MIYSVKLFAHSAITSSDSDAEKRLPSIQFPLPAVCARILPLSPISELAEVQNGICSLAPPYGIAYKSSVIAVPVFGCHCFKGDISLRCVIMLFGNTAAIICPVKVGGRVWRFGYESENIAVGGFGYHLGCIFRCSCG